MRLPKWAVPVGGVLVVGGALASREWNEIKSRERAREDAVATEQAAVRITASLSKLCPSPARPIRVTVKNTTPRTLKSVTFHLGVYEEGRLADLDPSSVDEQWTTALAPGGEESRCSAASVPVNPTQFLKPEKRGTNKATFYERGERVPGPAP